MLRIVKNTKEYIYSFSLFLVFQPTRWSGGPPVETKLKQQTIFEAPLMFFLFYQFSSLDQGKICKLRQENPKLLTVQGGQPFGKTVCKILKDHRTLPKSKNQKERKNALKLSITKDARESLTKPRPDLEALMQTHCSNQAKH